jgi:hypothetical protein
MEKTRAESGRPGKKQYAEPTVTEVPLRPDDAVLGACKVGNTGTAGPLQGACTSPAPCYNTTPS